MCSLFKFVRLNMAWHNVLGTIIACSQGIHVCPTECIAFRFFQTFQVQHLAVLNTMTNLLNECVGSYNMAASSSSMRNSGRRHDSCCRLSAGAKALCLLATAWDN